MLFPIPSLWALNWAEKLEPKFQVGSEARSFVELSLSVSPLARALLMEKLCNCDRREPPSCSFEESLEGGLNPSIFVQIEP
ncbi:unnamed protein product [Citrullus colocynthis]|uniref:Uncharacterized protein n=1 Tax=Citrullus colocynthis TaxID=252529 RepID=A0ABP0Y4D8_9ROSI